MLNWNSKDIIQYISQVNFTKSLVEEPCLSTCQQDDWNMSAVSSVRNKASNVQVKTPNVQDKTSKGSSDNSHTYQKKRNDDDGNADDVNSNTDFANNHKKILTGKKMCSNVCKEVFITNDALIHHSAKHKLPSICQHCGKTFKTRSRLYFHDCRHIVSERRFNCSKCGAKFVYKADLRRHEFVHSRGPSSVSIPEQGLLNAIS